jgi:MSHA biogenesis protein MshQ
VEVEARDSEGSITPGYGRESSPEGVRIASSSLIVPAAGRNGASGAGTLGGATAFAATGTAGRFRNDAVVFDEAGIIRLAASVADGDYLGAGAVAAAPSGNVGRFFPARFVLAAGSSITPSCGSFTYMDQAQLGVSYRLEAREAGGNVTQNYDTALLGANAVATQSITAENADSGVDLGARLNGLVGPWVSGAASISTMAATFSRNPSPDGPFDSLDIGVRATDPLHDTMLFATNMNAATNGDCAVAANCDVVKLGTSTRIRYGRLMVKPSFGPETRDLGVALEAQYFDGSLFARNVLDGCTTYSRAAASLSAFSGNLAAGETSVTAPIAGTTLITGESNPSTPLLLSAPGVGNDGAVDVRLDVAPHLEFDWSGSGAADPTGNARFGRYRGNDRIIFWKER